MWVLPVGYETGSNKAFLLTVDMSCMSLCADICLCACGLVQGLYFVFVSQAPQHLLPCCLKFVFKSVVLMYVCVLSMGSFLLVRETTDYLLLFAQQFIVEWLRYNHFIYPNVSHTAYVHVAAWEDAVIDELGFSSHSSRMCRACHTLLLLAVLLCAWCV